jgi:folate-binding protein YgfZ
VENQESPLIADIAIIRLTGPDAEKFAQSQFMGDVNALAPGQWQWSGWLSAKGRVQALFALLRVAQGELLLLLLDVPAQPFVDALQRFVFRSKVFIALDTSWAVAADWTPFASAHPSRDRVLEGREGALGLDVGTEASARRAWLVPIGGTPSPEASRRWREFDLRHGLPRWSASREHSWTPHMLSLDRLRAFSVKKGCYPGQEIVARTHFLGQTKRQAWWVEGESLASGDTVSDVQGRVLGEVIESTADGRGALAVLAAPPGIEAQVRGHSVRISLPTEGMARPN